MSEALLIENELLLQCARSTLGESHIARIAELVKKNPHWDSLLTLGAHHKLLPLLYKHLLAVCPADIPPKTREQLEKFCWANSINSLEKTRTLIQVAKLFASNNIEMITVKGPVFTARYMGDISLRSYCDVDILVSKEKFEKAIQLLVNNGFSCIPNNISEKYFIYFSLSHYHGQLISGDGTIVELHWQLSGNCGARKLDYDFLKLYIEIQELQRYKLPTICTEALLVYLSIHAQNHYWQRYDYLLCIAEIIQHSPGINWQEVCDFAEKLKIEKVILLSIYMACNIIGCQVNCQSLTEKRYLEKLPVLKQRHEDNWQNINCRTIENINIPGQNYINLYPWRLRLAQRKVDLLLTYWKKFFVPGPTDWNSFKIDYSLRFILYFVRPTNALKNYLSRSRVIIHHRHQD